MKSPLHQRCVNSGHSIKEVRRNILSSLKGWRSKMDRCNSSNQPVHRSAKESAASRRHKKITGKSSWFKERGNADKPVTNSVRVNIARDTKKEKGKAEEAGEIINDCSDDRNITNSVRVYIAKDANGGFTKHGGAEALTKKKKQENKRMQPKITSVMFVEHTRWGTLALALRQKMESLAPMVHYRFRIVENEGTALSNMLSKKNPWSGSACGRKKCHPCSQKSDKVEPCSAGNVLYESRCTLCNGLDKERSQPP